MLWKGVLLGGPFDSCSSSASTGARQPEPSRTPQRGEKRDLIETLTDGVGCYSEQPVVQRVVEEPRVAVSWFS